MVFFQEIIYLKKIKDGAYIINLDEILAIINSNEFNYKNKIGEFILTLKTWLIILKIIQLVK